MAFAQLGNIIFDGPTSPSKKVQTGAKKFSKLELINSKAILQDNGAELDKISLEMFFHWSFCDPDFQISQLKIARDKAEPMDYITGDGFLLGSFVIDSITETTNSAFRDGVTWDASVTVELMEYSTPELERSRALQARKDGFALRSNNPSAVVGSAAPMDAPSRMADFMSKAQGVVTDIQKNTALIFAGVNQADKIFRAVGIDTGLGIDAMNGLKGVINSTSGYGTRFSNVLTDADGLSAALTSLQGSTAAKNTNQMALDTTNVGNKTTTLNSSFSAVAAFAGTRRK